MAFPQRKTHRSQETMVRNLFSNPYGHGNKLEGLGLFLLPCTSHLYNARHMSVPPTPLHQSRCVLAAAKTGMQSKLMPTAWQGRTSQTSCGVGGIDFDMSTCQIFSGIQITVDTLPQPRQLTTMNCHSLLLIPLEHPPLLVLCICLAKEGKKKSFPAPMQQRAKPKSMGDTYRIA